MVSGSDFSELTFASNRLQNLECSLMMTADENKLSRSVRKIGSYKALTRLELSRFRPNGGADFAAMRTLPLQELVLIHCHNLEVQLMMPGALLSLRKLHIEESDKRRRKLSRQSEIMEKLAACSRQLLSLPHLHQLSGSGLLLKVVMKDVLQTWHVAKYQKGSMTQNCLHRPAQNTALKVWIKP